MLDWAANIWQIKHSSLLVGEREKKKFYKVSTW
jgi:hypothetical protein